jgi:hypothetical protein
VLNTINRQDSKQCFEYGQMDRKVIYTLCALVSWW